MRSFLSYKRVKIFFFMSFLFVFVLSADGKEEGKMLEMTLDECLNVALKNNLDIQLKVLDLEVSEEDVNIQKAPFDPSINTQFYYVDSVSPNTYVLEEVSKLKTTTMGKSMSFSQKLYTGTSYDVSMSTSRRKYNATLQGLNPAFDAELKLSMTQPLLKNLSPQVNKVYILIAMNNKRISSIDLKKKLSDTIFSVIDAYWNLVYAIEDLKAKEKSLGLARELLALNEAQIEVGTLPPVEIYQAKSAVAEREEAVIIAKNAVEEAQDELIYIMNLEKEDRLWWGVKIIPKEDPSPEFIETDLQRSISQALSRNYELKQSRINLKSWDIQIRYDKNQLLPEIDLKGSLTLDGISGTSNYWGADYPFEGDYLDAYEMMLERDYYSYNLTLDLEFPLFNRSARSSYAKSNIEKRKQIINIKKLENEIILEVKNLVRSIESNRKRIEVTEVAKVLAEKKLEVEEEKYKLGLTTNYTVLDYQEDLAIALNAEIKAKIDYRLSVASLKSLEGTLLDDYEFILESSERMNLPD